ncbi:hypothetical protein AOLI_G00240710 [Acnodon oligacanthus]
MHSRCKSTPHSCQTYQLLTLVQLPLFHRRVPPIIWREKVACVFFSEVNPCTPCHCVPPRPADLQEDHMTCAVTLSKKQVVLL